MGPRFVQHRSRDGAGEYGGGFHQGGDAGTLTDQEAYDLAAYINTRPRPDFAGKELDWPKGDPPPDVAYPVNSKKK